MLVNFLLMCLSVLILPRRNPKLAGEIRVIASRSAQMPIALGGVVLLGVFLVVHVVKDLQAPVAAWYFRSTWLWVLVMALASLVFLREWRVLKASGVDVDARFAELPPE